MAVPDCTKVYPRTGDTQTVYLKNVVDDPAIRIGAFTIYNDFVHDPRDFQKNNVLYHYPINGDRLRIGKFCSIACGARFLLTAPTTPCVPSPTTPSPSSTRPGAIP